MARYDNINPIKYRTYFYVKVHNSKILILNGENRGRTFSTNMIRNHEPQYSVIKSSALAIILLGIKAMSFNHTYCISETYVLMNSNSEVL